MTNPEDSPSPLPVWAPRVKQHLIRRLYTSDAQGLLDEDLLNEVGWGLHARCASFIAAVEAARGRAACPVCGTIIPHHGQPDELLHCPACAWELPWRSYFQTIQHKQLSGAAEVLALFQDFIDRFPRARQPQEKMLLIDNLIHAFHINLLKHWPGLSIPPGGDPQPVPTRATCVNLIEGSYHQVVDFLDTLSYGPDSTPGLLQRREEWRETIHQIASAWNDPS